MSRFEPVGEEARWRVAYRLLRVAPTGTVVTYELLGEALGLHPFRDRTKIQAAVRRAAEDHLTNERRAIQATADEGYRVVDATGQLALSRAHQKKALREVERSHEVAVNVDLNGVDPAVRARLEAQAETTAAQLEYNRRLEGRLRQLEAAVVSTVRKTPELET